MHKSLRIISRHALRKCSSIHKVLPAPFASPDEKSSRKFLHNDSACVSFFYSTLFLKYTKYSCELYALPNEKILRQSNHGGLNGVSVFAVLRIIFRHALRKCSSIHKVFLRIICLAERKNPPPIQSRRLKRRFRFCCFTDYFPSCFAKMLVNT